MTFIPATGAKDYVVAMPSANTQYPFSIPDGTKAIEFKAREAFDVLHSLTAGAVDTNTPPGPYMTLISGNSYVKDRLVIGTGTLYFACASAGKNVEIRIWS